MTIEAGHYDRIANISRREAQKELRKIFKTKDIFVIGQGFNINFSLPLDTYILEEQFDAVRAINWTVTQVQAVVNQSGMNDHLHVHVREIHEWEKKN